MYSRRSLLANTLNGLGLLALTDLLQANEDSSSKPFAPRPQHLPRKAKRCIFLFMYGGPSAVDTFDYKPELQKRDGQEIDVDYGNVG